MISRERHVTCSVQHASQSHLQEKMQCLHKLKDHVE